MKPNDVVKSVVESVKKVDKVKLIGGLGMGLGLVASWLSNSAEKEELNKTIEEKVAKALAKKDGGVQ